MKPFVQLGISYFPAGKSAVPANYKPGDFILTHGTAFYSKLIRVGQRMRYGKDSPCAYYNHAAMIVSHSGDLVEALGDGVDKTHIDKYQPQEYHLFSIERVLGSRAMGSGEMIENNDRARIVRFAHSCVGLKYDWLDIISISISLLTGARLSLSTEGHLICSELVARALERSNAIFPRSSQNMMPADLAAYFIR